MSWITIGILVFFVLVVGGILIYLIKHTPVFTVKEQQAVIIERFGKFQRVAESGICIMMPFIDQKRKFKEGQEWRDFVDLRERAVDLPEQSVITKDNIGLQVDSVAYYQITKAERAVYGIDDVISAVNHLIKTVLRDVIGATTLQELLSGRENINKSLREQVERATGDWGITIRSVELQAVTPPKSYVEEMQKVSEAELSKKAVVTKAEGQMQSMILEAKSEAEKIRLLGELANLNPEQVLKFRYLEALEKIANGNATKVFFPFPPEPNSSQNPFLHSLESAAGFDAYSDDTNASDTKALQEREAKTKSLPESNQTTPIATQEEATLNPNLVKKKIIRRVIPAPQTPPPAKPKPGGA